MKRGDLIWSWVFLVSTALIIAAMLIRSALKGTLLFFAAGGDGPSWATVSLAVLATINATRLRRHYRERPKAAGGAL